MSAQNKFHSSSPCYGRWYDEDGEHWSVEPRHLWDHEGYCRECGQESDEAKALRLSEEKVKVLTGDEIKPKAGWLSKPHPTHPEEQ